MSKGPIYCPDCRDGGTVIRTPDGTTVCLSCEQTNGGAYNGP